MLSSTRAGQLKGLLMTDSVDTRLYAILPPSTLCAQSCGDINTTVRIRQPLAPAVICDQQRKLAVALDTTTALRTLPAATTQHIDYFSKAVDSAEYKPIPCQHYNISLPMRCYQHRLQTRNMERDPCICCHYPTPR